MLADEAVRSFHYWSRYTDAALETAIREGSTGARNRARHLMLLDTPQRRARANSEGSTLTNLRPGGRPSDDVRTAVLRLQDLIDQDTEGEELYGERCAREDRERQAAEREIRLRVARELTGK